MLIRTAGREDVADIAALEKSAPSAWSPAQIEAELKQSNGVSLIAACKADTSAVGWCCARFLPPEAELLKITVSPRYRRSGVGTRLFAALLDHILKAQCTEIFLEVRQRNIFAQQFYRKNGFLEYALRKRYYHDPPDNGIVFKKCL